MLALVHIWYIYPSPSFRWAQSVHSLVFLLGCSLVSWFSNTILLGNLRQYCIPDSGAVYVTLEVCIHNYIVRIHARPSVGIAPPASISDASLSINFPRLNYMSNPAVKFRGQASRITNYNAAGVSVRSIYVHFYTFRFPLVSWTGCPDNVPIDTTMYSFQHGFVIAMQATSNCP